MQVKLEVIKGPEKGRTFTIDERGTCIAGRGEDARFRFSEDDPYISRHHFCLEVAPPNVYYRDLDSVTNPSMINGVYVEETELSDGDLIEVGYTKIRVCLDVALKTIRVRCLGCKTAMEIFPDEIGGDMLCEGCAGAKKAPGPKPSAKKDKDQKDIRDIKDGKGRRAGQKPGARPDITPDIRPGIKPGVRPAPAPGGGGIRCRCGKVDVTRRADSDGRAKELAGKAEYVCPGCTPPKDGEGGKIIGEYEVIRKIGEGGMGKVYLVRHAATDRLGALKMMNIFNRQLAGRFSREIRLMKKADHPNVLSYLDSGQERGTGRPFLVMEFVDMGSMDRMLKTHPNGVPPKIGVKSIIDALAGLEYIHRIGIVHRDLKPENILVKKGNGGAVSPKITDFGLAREFSKAGGSVLTKLGTAMGTVLYMPPEQIKDAHSVKEPADLYSMGVTLYHLLTARYPFKFPTQADIERFVRENKNIQNQAQALRAIMELERIKNPHLIVIQDEPIPIRNQKPGLDADLAAVVDRSIKKSVGERYHSALAFQDELIHILPRL